MHLGIRRCHHTCLAQGLLWFLVDMHTSRLRPCSYTRLLVHKPLGKSHIRRCLHNRRKGSRCSLANSHMCSCLECSGRLHSHRMHQDVCTRRCPCTPLRRLLRIPVDICRESALEDYSTRRSRRTARPVLDRRIRLYLGSGIRLLGIQGSRCSGNYPRCWCNGRTRRTVCSCIRFRLVLRRSSRRIHRYSGTESRGMRRSDRLSHFPSHSHLNI